MGALVEARGLCFQYPDGTEALRGVDLDLDGGETVILFGANGSGKTTFLLHLSGLLQPSKGSLMVGGLAVEKQNLAAIRRKVGLLFQDADDQLFMPTVLEDIAFGLLNQGMTREAAREAATNALTQVGLAHVSAKAPYHLSGGEKRRAALAGVLAMNPDVLAFDEPTTALDPPAQQSLAHLLLRLPQAKLISTHDAHFARAVGTRAVFFEGGKVVGAGPVEEVIGRFGWEAQ